ncbi:MAG: 5-methyltetrahydropteroyltriglutamate--homocysteine S-methyltransferase, partial [Verrucomicrobiota bacterium]
LTFLALGKEQSDNFSRFDLLDRLVPVYVEVLKRLADAGAEWVQLDEPILATDLEEAQLRQLRNAYKLISDAAPNIKIMVAAYFGELRDNLPVLLSLPVSATHIDAVRGRDEVDSIVRQLPENKTLSLGVIDGRNIWRSDLSATLEYLKPVSATLKSRLMIAPSCSLIHVPISTDRESKIENEVLSWLAFADEKLGELRALSDSISVGKPTAQIVANQVAVNARKTSIRIHNSLVRDRLNELSDGMFDRESPFARRQRIQREKLNLPPFPTTTIGSFPQTQAIRAARAKFRKGEWTRDQYETFLRLSTSQCVDKQEQIGLDMLVHGEFERNDMVEYFGEQLEGFAFSSYGWVQSYGSRYVKPPIIFGDVSRPEPMTVEWSKYAQSLTESPMKGMLTGPVTILQWSFVRDDQPRHDTAMQIALAIRDEVVDLEAAGIAAIQIDEPAFREGLPLWREDWQVYLEWAVNAFRLSAAGVRDETQIHTHMCYSEFNDIIDSIAALDADVITIETARSNLELLDAFAEFNYPNEIGPGVYDIHSPRVPEAAEMGQLLEKAASVIPKTNLWVNPDCGLKTRGWEETEAALKNMVAAAQSQRGS